MRSKLILVACAAAFTLTGCSDETENPPTGTETPLETFVSDVTHSYTNIADMVSYSLGYEFKVKRDGSVIALGVSSKTAGTFNVALYETALNGSEGTLIGSTTIEITQLEIDADAHAFKYVDLTVPVTITKEKIYCVAYSNQSKAFDRIGEDSGDPYTLPYNVSSSQVIIMNGTYGAAADTYPANDGPGTDIYMADIKFKY